MPFVQEGIQYYQKKLNHFAEIEIMEIKGRGDILTKEIMTKATSLKPYILLDAGGRSFSSEAFAEFLDRQVQWNFILGGAYGVPVQIKDEAEMLMSLSAMTMPHELVRLVFLEQLYRAMTIINKTGYHH